MARETIKGLRERLLRKDDELYEVRSSMHKAKRELKDVESISARKQQDLDRAHQQRDAATNLSAAHLEIFHPMLPHPALPVLPYAAAPFGGEDMCGILGRSPKDDFRGDDPAVRSLQIILDKLVN